MSRAPTPRPRFSLTFTDVDGVRRVGVVWSDAPGGGLWITVDQRYVKIRRLREVWVIDRR